MMILHKDPGHNILHFSVCVVEEYLHFRRISFTPNKNTKNEILRKSQKPEGNHLRGPGNLTYFFQLQAQKIRPPLTHSGQKIALWRD